MSSGGEICAPLSPLQHCGFKPCYSVRIMFFHYDNLRRNRFRRRLKSVAIGESCDVSGLQKLSVVYSPYNVEYMKIHTLQIDKTSCEISKRFVFVDKWKILLELVGCITKPFRRNISRNDKCEIVIIPFYSGIECIRECILEQSMLINTYSMKVQRAKQTRTETSPNLYPSFYLSCL